MLDVQELKTEIGNKLKKAREERGYSQKNLADLIGLTKVGYGALERGQNLVSLQHLIPLARILDKPLTYFFSSYVTAVELNDFSHDPLIQRLLVNFQALATDHAKRTVVAILELMVKKQAERGDGMTKK